MKSKADSEEQVAAEPAKEPEKAVAPKPATTPAIPKPGAEKAKIFGKQAQQKPFMPPRGGKGGGGAIRQMRSQRGR